MYVIQITLNDSPINKCRDEVCRNGDLLNSPALNYSLLDLSLSVNDMRERKMAEESISGNPEEDEIKTEDSIQEVSIFFNLSISILI